MNKFVAIITIAALTFTITACGSNTPIPSAEVSSSNPSATGNEKKVESAAIVETKPSFYFTADEGGSITKINALQNKVVDTIKLEGSVHNVQVSPDGKVLGATLVQKSDGHGGNHGKEKGIALFYDTVSNQLIKKVDMGSHPAHIVFTSDQNYACTYYQE